MGNCPFRRARKRHACWIWNKSTVPASLLHTSEHLRALFSSNESFLHRNQTLAEVSFSQTHYFLFRDPRARVWKWNRKPRRDLLATPEVLQSVFLSGCVTLAVTVQNYRQFYRIQIEHRAGRNVVINLCPYFWKQQPGDFLRILFLIKWIWLVLREFLITPVLVFWNPGHGQIEGIREPQTWAKRINVEILDSLLPISI